MAAMNARRIVVDPFCFRQFEKPSMCRRPQAHHRHIGPMHPQVRVNEDFVSNDQLVPGYAPFCKHFFIPNFVGAVGNIVEITEENAHKLRSGYEARTPKELPVLSRWFPGDSISPPPPAKYLDLILYSREQIRKENAAMGEDSGSDAPWGIVSIKAQDVDHELPMQPITMMRNALGVAEGGSGIALDPEDYAAAVAFWSTHGVRQE